MGAYLRTGIAPTFLLLCLLLGGASAAGFAANMVLQLLALPIIVWACLARRATPMPRASRQLMLIALLIVVLIAVQLVPLPPSIWTSLPGREQVAADLAALGTDLPWLPISLMPRQTLASALWLLPAFATLLAVLRLGSFKPALLAWIVVAVAIVSVIIGALQLFGGDNSRWYFYAITNRGSTTGFFSNANHLATLMVAAIPFVAALKVWSQRRQSVQRSAGLAIIVAGAFAVLLVGIIINTSIAGIGLAVPTAAASILLLMSAKGRLPRWSGYALAALGAVALVAAFSAPFGNNITSAGSKSSTISRYTSFTNSSEAALDYAPLGSGIGTFQYIYPSYEDVATVTRVYVNHVHSDYIELFLETGFVGAAIFLLFLLWWVRRTIAIWRTDTPDHFARAASIATAVILAHSLVDYPLRTAAISALFAAACALMAEPRPRGRAPAASEKFENKPRHLTAD